VDKKRDCKLGEKKVGGNRGNNGETNEKTKQKKKSMKKTLCVFKEFV